MAHEASYEINQLIQVLEQEAPGPVPDALALTALQVQQLLPPWKDEPQTPVPPAPPR